MEASSIRLAILTVCVEEPVSSGWEHWHCCQSARAKTLKGTSRYWMVPVSADARRQPAGSTGRNNSFDAIHARLFSGISTRIKISRFEGVTVAGCRRHHQQ